MTGTTLAQVIGLLMAPVVTRFFSPEDFSVLEQFSMFMNILVVVVTGKYEFAIMQPAEKESARHLVALTIRIAAVSCLVLLLLALTGGDIISGWLQNDQLTHWIWLLPFALFPFAVYNSINYWFSRQNQYKIAATSKIYASLTSEPLKVMSGFFKTGAPGLLVSTTLGNMVTGLYCWLQFKKSEPMGISDLDKSKMKEMMITYREYPLYTIWGSLFNRMAQWAHVGLFSSVYGLPALEAVGFMALSRRVFMYPLSVLSQSFSQVFYQKISAIQDPIELRRFYNSNLRKFSILAAIFVLVVLVLPQNTMAFIFGDKWGRALDFLKILCFWFAINFVVSSLSFIMYRLKLQRLSLALDVSHFALTVGAILITFQLGCDVMLALKWLVAAKVFYLACNLGITNYYLNRYVKTGIAGK